MTPFCDGLTTTTTRDRVDDLVASLSPMLAAAGGVATPRGFAFPTSNPHRPGQARLGVEYGVGRFHFSGVCLAALRAQSLFLDVLHELGAGPHRLTLIQLARDDSATDAPPYLADLYSRAKAGTVALTRKRLPPSAIDSRIAPSRVDSRDTGTVYCGHRKRHEASAIAYDKQHERLCHGFPDPGPLLRIEVSARAPIGPSLRDAAVCAPLFYHLASPSLCTAPPDVPAWVPAGEGFVLPPRVLQLDTQRLRRLVDNGTADPLLRLAASIGPEGLRYLDGLLRQRSEFLAKPSEASAQVRAATRPATGTTG